MLLCLFLDVFGMYVIDLRTIWASFSTGSQGGGLGGNASVAAPSWTEGIHEAQKRSEKR